MKDKHKEGRQHRFLFNKRKLLQCATANLVQDPASAPTREYVRGLCDALHGTTDEETAKAIHLARQVIIASKE